MSFSSDWAYRSTADTAAKAFERFRRDKVDLDPDDADKARRSRDYLKDQLIIIKKNNPDFPRITGDYLPFGSFARNTKVRPLDDIDMLVILNRQDVEVVANPGEPYTYNVRITSNSSPLRPYADEKGYGYSYINSTKILNRFKSGLQKVSNYQRSEIKRTGVAVVLNLSSYPWAFDIVPTIPVPDYWGTTLYYLIPNGKSKWMKSDPRIDQKLVTEANKSQNSFLLPLIRVIKYWNVKSLAAPRLMAYHLETLLINAFKYGNPAIVSNIRSSIPDAFQQLARHVMYTCPDPKGLGPYLDAYLLNVDREKVRDAAIERSQYATCALDYEQKGDHAKAIKWWGYVFPNFE